MIKCMPVVVAFSEEIMSFKVTVLNADTGIDSIHTMYGGGTGVPGHMVGEASLILKRKLVDPLMSTKWHKPKVVYLDGYLSDGKEFNVKTESKIIMACIQAAKVIWGDFSL